MASVNDFDFLFGTWIVHHRKLRQRLVACNDWDEFSGTLTAWPTMGGAGNIDDNWLNDPAGAYRAVSWDTTDTDHPTWNQAFSVDNGQTWECNWLMTYTRQLTTS